MRARENTTSQLQEIRNSVSELAKRAGITPQRAFAAWYAINFFELEEDSALMGASLDGGEDHGIDLLVTDHQRQRVLLLQAHYPIRPDNAAQKSKFDGLVALVPQLDDPQVFKKAGRPDIAAAVEEFGEHRNEYDAIIGLVSLATNSAQIARSASRLSSGTGRLAPWEFFYVGVEQIVDRYEAIKVGGESVAEDTLKFEGTWFEDKGEYGNAWVGSVSAAELSRLYTTHKEGLFARNVRLYLGSRKGGINEQIIETAKSSPGRFWALNNGITIVADTVNPAKDGVVKLSRFSVVNGCQTTVSLTRAGAPANAKVLVRLVATNRHTANEIVRYNNTQNAVRIWAVRAVDSIQQRLRVAFVSIGVAYAPKADDKRRTGEAILLDRVAQFLASRSEHLTTAIQQKSQLFDQLYQSVFPHDIQAEDVYLAWLLGMAADDARQARLSALDEMQDVDPVMRSFLGLAGTYWIVHCAGKLVAAFNPQPIGLVLSAMRTPEFQNALKKYTDLALDMYIELAVDTYSSEDFPSVRQALMSPKFLQKIDMKLSGRVVGAKAKKKLPSLESASKSAPSRVG